MTRTELDHILAVVARKATTVQKVTTGDYFQRLQESATFVEQEVSLKCPCCAYNMYEVESFGIVVDFCLNCQSVWFDEGELTRALAVARKRGPIDMVPADVSEHDTATLICYMLETLTV